MYATSGRTGGIIGDNGASNTYSHVNYNAAINTQIRQTGTATTTTGRIGGTNEYGYANNIAKTDLYINWRNAQQIVSGGKHGTNISDAELRTQAPYTARDWGFANIWRLDATVSPYPLLQYFYPIILPTLELIIDKDTIKVGEHATITATGMISGDSVVWPLPEELSDAITLVSTGPNAAEITGTMPANGILPVSVAVRVTTEKNALGSVTIDVLPEPITPPQIPDSLIIAIEVGETCNLYGLTSLREQADMADYAWSSSDDNIAEVNQRGKVTAISLGIATISLSDGSHTVSMDILVREKPFVPIEKIEFIPEMIQLLLPNGRITAQELNAMIRITPEDATCKDLRFYTDDEEVLTVNSLLGSVFATGVGNATVTVRATNPLNRDAQGVLHIEVIQPVESVTIDIADGTVIDVLDFIDLPVVVTPGNATYDTVIWDCVPSGLASIDSDGQMTALAEGTVTVTATVNGVNSAPVSIRIGPDLQTYELANWKTLYFNTANSVYLPSSGVAKDDSHISGQGITGFGLNGTKTMTASGWNASTFNTPKAWLATIPAAGYSNFTISYSQRANDPSPNYFTLEYSLDGVDWTPVDSEYQVRAFNQAANVPAEFEKEINIGPIADTLYLRWRAGAYNWSNGNQGPAALSFLQDVVVTGEK